MNSLLGMYGKARLLGRLDHVLPSLSPVRLPDTSDEGVVDYLRPEEIPRAYRLVTEAAGRGDNVGLREFPSREQYSEMLSYNDVFTVKDAGSGALRALVGVGPSTLTRSTRPCLASITTTRCGDWAARSPGESTARLVQLGEEMARRLGYGYTGVVTQVFTSCTDTYLRVREEGYLPCAVVPMSGEVQGHGLDSSAVLFKDILVDERETFQDHDEELKKLGISPYLERTDTGAEWKCLEVPGLPAEYTFATGVKSVIRSMTAADIPALHELFVYYGETGQGFGTDEYPCLPDMMEIMKDYYNVIIEERSTAKPVAMLSFSDSYYARGERFADGSAFLMPEYFGAGMGTEMVKIRLGLCKGFGCYRGGLTDIVFNNIKTLKMNRPLGYITIGCLPRGVRMVEKGWMDTLLYYVPYSNFQTFQEIMTAQKTKY